MITLHEKDDIYTASFHPRPPLIYLDHCALRILSSNPVLRKFFFDTFRNKGTLFFSLPNMTDFLNNSGQSLLDIESFLEEIGPYWLPLEYNPQIVIGREKSGLPAPCAEDFFKSYLPYVYQENPLTLKKMVVLATEEPNRSLLLQTRDNGNRQMAALLQDTRMRWCSSKEIRKQAFQIPQFNFQQPTEFIYHSLLQQICKNTFLITPNHAQDFQHAVTSTAYSNFLVLDAHWASLISRINLPAQFTHYYPKAKIENFLEDFNNFEILS